MLPSPDSESPKGRRDFSHIAFQCQGNMEKKTEDGDQKRLSSFPLEIAAWIGGPQTVTYSHESLEISSPNQRC